jgi:hypothetical protein
MNTWNVLLTSRPLIGDVEQLADDLLEVLEADERALGPSISANLAQRTVSVHFDVTSDGEVAEAVQLAGRIVREAAASIGWTLVEARVEIELVGASVAA